MTPSKNNPQNKQKSLNKTMLADSERYFSASHDTAIISKSSNKNVSVPNGSSESS